MPLFYVSSLLLIAPNTVMTPLGVGIFMHKNYCLMTASNLFMNPLPKIARYG
jgi:hypothetical protein